MLTTLAVENYRSLRRLVVPLGRLSVVVGANGTGKSSLYRALRLLAESARNGAVAALARDGGLPSTLWAGPEHLSRSVRDGTHPVQGTVRTGPVSLRASIGAYHQEPAYDGTVNVAESSYVLHDTADPDVFIAEIDTVLDGADGQRRQTSLVQIFRVRDGRIAMLRDYFTVPPASR